jgi:hypothetical protein
MSEFDEIFEFPKLQNSYIFKFDDINELLDHYDLNKSDFKIIAKKLNLIENLYAFKKSFKNGILIMDNGLNFKFNSTTLSLDDIEVLDYYNDKSNTIVKIYGFPMSDEQADKIIQEKIILKNKLTTINDLNKDEIGLLFLQLTPRDVLSLCSINTKFRYICQKQDLFAQLMRKHYPNAFLTNDPKSQYKAITNGVKTRYKVHVLRNNFYSENIVIDNITLIGTSSDFEKLKPNYSDTEIDFEVKGNVIPTGEEMWLLIFYNIFIGDDPDVEVFKRKKGLVSFFLEKYYIGILEIIFEDFYNNLTEGEVSEERIEEILGDFTGLYDRYTYVIQTQPVEWLDFLTWLKLPNPTQENIYNYCMDHEKLAINENLIAKFVAGTF